MDKRGQFTFYRSFWEAIKGLPKKDRLPILEAIISYALDGDEPKALTLSQSAFFSLVKPNLDASRRKASNGKQGGSKPKANGKQNASKKENEIENEIEIELEGENDRKQTPSIGSMFESFFSSYPDKRDRDGAKRAWDEVVKDEQTANLIMVALDEWYDSAQWNDQNGAYIPMAANWLRKGYWKNSPTPALDASWDIDLSESMEYAKVMLQKGGLNGIQ